MPMTRASSCSCLPSRLVIDQPFSLRLFNASVVDSHPKTRKKTWNDLDAVDSARATFVNYSDQSRYVQCRHFLHACLVGGFIDILQD